MELGPHRASVPLYESGAAPRILVTDIDRLEEVADGVYCFVCTRPVTYDGRPHREVVLYIDATPAAIARGIMLSLTVVQGIHKLIRTAKSLLQFH